ncbi:MAG: murein L,D-transpeptidase catalytic domain family protein [Bacteroidetes bacterium]|nr:murein L,D-transpeptidase catalytic domain family protein [Bacteroidota bacterium]
MKKAINPVSTGILFCLLLVVSTLQAGTSKYKYNKYSKRTTHKHHSYHKDFIKPLSKDFQEEADALYDEIDLKELGLSEQAFEYALKGYNYLVEHHSIAKSNVISICDFSQSSRKKRLYVVDLEQKKVLINTYVAHGRRSGSEFARSFSNNPESHKSSLGFYITDKTYYGEHGLALKIHGLEKGINDKAAKRNIVVHGSEYVGADFIKFNKFNGRSYGCPAVPSSEADDLIETIKDGSCLFIYHPTKRYLARSKILNG